MTLPSSFAFALACGAGGAWVDVTSDVLFEEGSIPFTDGRTSQFDDFGPGVFSFTLKNPTGKYTPDNPSTSLAIPMSEGMGAVIEVAGMLVSGTVRNIQVIFPTSEKDVRAARVRVTVDDMLGSAGRRKINGTNLINAMILGSPAYLWFPMDDPAGSLFARESSGTNQIPFASVASYGGSSPVPTFGVAGVPAVGSTQVELTGSQSGFSQAFGTQRRYPINYSPGSWGAWGFWFTPTTATVNFVLSWLDGQFTDTFSFTCSSLAAGMKMNLPNATVTASSPALNVGEPHYFSVVITPPVTHPVFGLQTAHTADFYMDGVLQGTSVGSLSSAGQTFTGPRDLSLRNSLTGSSVRVQNLTHTAGLINEYAVSQTDTEAGWLAVLSLMAADVKFSTLPTTLATQTIVAPTDVSGGTLLSALNGLLRTEQGYMYAETTGTLLAPVQRVVVKARDRERALDFTFDVSEIQDRVPFVRSLSSTVSQFTANGPLTSALFTDADLVDSVGSASSSESVLLREYSDLFGFASDRVNRGKIVGIPIRSITINAQDPLISRWADLIAVRQGHRVRITGLPSAQLGYSSWDAFVVGREFVATDNPAAFLFTFYLSAWSRVSIYDTDRYAAGGALTLSTAIASTSATSMSVATSGPKLETVDVPYDLLIDKEQVTVTACTTATPQVATITRGVNGTTATTHSTAASIELATPALYAF